MTINLRQYFPLRQGFHLRPGGFGGQVGSHAKFLFKICLASCFVFFSMPSSYGMDQKYSYYIKVDPNNEKKEILKSKFANFLKKLSDESPQTDKELKFFFPGIPVDFIKFLAKNNPPLDQLEIKLDKPKEGSDELNTPIPLDISIKNKKKEGISIKKINLPLFIQSSFLIILLYCAEETDTEGTILSSPPFDKLDRIKLSKDKYFNALATFLSKIILPLDEYYNKKEGVKLWFQTAKKIDSNKKNKPNIQLRNKLIKLFLNYCSCFSKKN